VRLAILAEPNGVWKCRTIYNCTEACPRDIEITRAIREVTRAIVTGEVK
jgi:succinate dehydrogenase / fumarate reductase, iron-sulfur subunit